MLRIDLRIGDDDTVADTLKRIPRVDRPAALRVLIRRHFRELPEIAGIAPTPSTPTPAPTRPAPVTAAVAPVTPIGAVAPTPASPEKRAALARRLVVLGAHTAKPVATLGIAALLAFALPTHNAVAGTLDLDLNIASVHTEAWARRSLNQRNPGAGIEYHFNRTWGAIGGEYFNSYRRPTWYAAVTFTPFHLGADHGWRLDAGVAGGIATGYGHASYMAYAWIPDRASATGWRLTTTSHRYARNAFSPLMAAALVRIRAPDGLGANLLAVPNTGPRSSGFIGLQFAVPLH